MRRVLLVVSAVGLFAGLAPSAFGATILGDTPTPNLSCLADTTYLQTVSAGTPYTAAADGVVTSWSYRTSGSPPAQVKFKVGHPGLSPNFMIVGESSLETPGANALNTYATRVPIHAGDDIGIYTSSAGDCVRGDIDYRNAFNQSDVVPPNSDTFTDDADQLVVSARVEPDADHDGFGDETQDQCPTDASTHGACPVAPVTPVTTVKKKKCKKHKKKHSASSAKKKHCKKKKKK